MALVRTPLAVIFLAGCVSMTPAADQIRVVRNANQVRNCTSLGEIESTSGWGGFAIEAGFENNKRTLRQETASRGGDTLLILGERGSFTAHTFGEAYRCGR